MASARLKAAKAVIISYAKKSTTSRSFGFVALCLAGTSSSIYHYVSKKLTASSVAEGSNDETAVTVFHLLLMRQMIILVTTAVTMPYLNAPFFVDCLDRKLGPFLIFRALAAFTATLAAQLAITRLHLPDYAAIVAITPIFTSLIGWPILDERPNAADVPLFLACFAGVLFIVRPSFLFHAPTETAGSYAPDLMGCLYAFGYVFSQAIVYVSMRKLRVLHMATVTFFYAFTSSILGFATLIILVCPVASWFSCLMSTMSTPTRVIQIYAVGLSSSALIFLQMSASKSLPAGFIALIPIIEMVIQFLWQVAILGVIPHSYSILGAIIITTAFIILTLRNLKLPNLKPQIIPNK